MGTKNCECCMMPLSKDPKKSGSDKYCSYCFVDGKLLAENLSLKEFKAKAFDGMVKSGHSKFSSWFFTWLIGFAPYWKRRQ